MTTTLDDIPGLFEIHITISKPQSAEIGQEILQKLRYFPFKFMDYFQNVVNVEPMTGDPPHPKGTPSAAQLPDGEEGHDIAKPWAMFTMMNPDYGSVRKTTIDALEIIAEYETLGVRRTIEVEKFISEKIPDSEVKPADYKGHKKTRIAPLYENHVQFEGTLKELPPYHDIIKFIQDKCNVTLHQFVDFSETPIVNERTKLYRVLSVYQSKREETLKLDRVLKNAMNGFYYRPSGISAEQVCLVAVAK